MAERYDSFTAGAPRRPFVLPRIAVRGCGRLRSGL